MPPLPVARALPRNMPPLPTSPALCPPTPWAPDVAVVRAPPRIPTPRRSAKPIAVALLLLGVFGGGLYVTTATELGARAARLVRP
jgi:hypothetical protein